MVTKVIHLEQQSDSLSDLLTQLDANTEILLMRGDKLVAKITPTSESQPETQLKQRTPGLHAGTTWVSDDFDDPLPDSFWLGEDE